MPGLIDDISIGLCETDTGLTWLMGGLGGQGLNPEPTGEMLTEAGLVMITEASLQEMVTETT